MTSLGANLGFVDEMYARYCDDPTSVSEDWQEFFVDYQAPPGQAARIAAAAPAAAPVADVVEASAPRVLRAAPQAQLIEEDGRTIKTVEPAASKAAGPDDQVTPLKGAAARIAENMEASLGVPTATSARTVPAKLLDENRRLINLHQIATSAPKISFTHMIAWAIVRALDEHPAMNAEYVLVDDKPHLKLHDAINLGLAVDVERRGERLLVVPNIKDAGRLSFPDFVSTYDSLTLRARQNKLEVSELVGTTATLTNPGMLGTALSVPRLMQRQAVIFGIGRIDYPPEYAGMSHTVISELGLSKVMTVTSTYDHRIIQGAESGAFLADLEKLLLGAKGFYERIFTELGVPHEPLDWAADKHPGLATGASSTEAIAKQASVLQLIRAHRVRGHLLADLDPLGYEPKPISELELSTYGLSVWDLDREFIAGGLGGATGTLSLREILEILRETYCRHAGVEFMHIPDTDVRAWVQANVEQQQSRAPLSEAERHRILERLNAAEAFERFLHMTYVGHKRFSLEGAEALIPMLDALLTQAADAGIEEAVIGMAHRGRLNVLATVVGKGYGAIFREFEGDLDPDLSHGSGDVKYHLGASGVHETPTGERIRLTLASNPSHLEAVDPVVEGMARARQDREPGKPRQRILPILIHGDAAFSGQGVVAETLNLSLLRGYRTGGTVHLVVNNQIGFTTGPEHLRSSLYATDVAKAVKAPILHVNGDQPEEAVRVIKLALAFRQAFQRDVVVDLVCYRRWGHNEADDPSYTHPTLYARIKTHRSVRKLYTEQLLRRGDIDPETAQKALEDFRQRLAAVHDEVREAQAGAQAGQPLQEVPAPQAPVPIARTAVDEETITRVVAALDTWPEGFTPHPKLVGQLSRRRQRYDSDEIDWALAEALAFGSLVAQGTPVRLSGEDSGRGTFSQRHAILYDHHTAESYIPLQHVSEDQAAFSVFDSLLSEFAVLGFEYGYSVNAPDALVMWEAQFGDFVNGAQVIIDQFIISAEDKWEQKSGLVLLLPHGYEGQGPEHSSARIERFLQLGASHNIEVVYPSSAAQYFHLLRRQALRHDRRPLVVLTGKSLLRNPRAVATRVDLREGGFSPVIDDPTVVDPSTIRRVVLCAGKLYWDLDLHREQQAVDDVAIVRVEQLYPFPREQVRGLLHRFERASEIVWAQEEPANMGAWSFVRPEIAGLVPNPVAPMYAGRPESPSPATGSSRRHLAEQERLLRVALE